MKRFMYFETTEGGMETVELDSPGQLGFLFGWKSPMCLQEDLSLEKWMGEAKVGGVCMHRLGALVRLADTTG